MYLYYNLTDTIQIHYRKLTETYKLVEPGYTVARVLAGILVKEKDSEKNILETRVN
jgi:hypothetical protein